MKSLAIVLMMTFMFLGCKRDKIASLPRSAFAPEPSYPAELEYQPGRVIYQGAPELELRKERIPVATELTVAPITTFAAAFEYAYQLGVREYGKESIDKQLPFLMDYEEGVWIVRGAIQHSKIPGTILLGGEVEMAFVGETGEVLYLLHTL